MQKVEVSTAVLEVADDDKVGELGWYALEASDMSATGTQSIRAKPSVRHLPGMFLDSQTDLPHIESEHCD